MQEVDLDHEGVKKILLVEITRNIKNAQLTKLKQDEKSFHLRFHDDYSFKIVLEDGGENGC